MGDDRTANCLDRPGCLHTRGISADDHGKSSGIAAIGNDGDDRAREKGGAGALAQTRYGERTSAATEDLSEQMPDFRSKSKSRNTFIARCRNPAGVRLIKCA
jgi:hypothetical protein